ncbi:MAG: HutD family protein [Xanthomonadales bacterium]|nr:HutD family protein [Xanthomonadales bacterium]
MSLRILRSGDSQRQPWANGDGSTRELMQWPGDGQPWQWRLSIADVDRDAPFSAFPGVDRILVLLNGDGLVLRFADGREARLDTPFALARFPGEAELSGGPIAGPTTDFNLMWQRDRFDAELWVRPMVGSIQLFAAPGETWALHVAAGHVDGDGRSLHLETGDTLVSIDDGSARRLHLDGAGTALAIRLKPLQERQHEG